MTRSFSLNRMAVNLGFSIGPAMGGILSAISYDFLFYSNAIAALIAGIVYISFFRNRKYRNVEEFEPKEIKSTISPYRDGKFLLFSFLCMMFSICFFQLLNTLTIFYKTEANLTQQGIGYLLGYSGFIIVLLDMLLVQIADTRFRLKFTLFIGTLLCGISFAILGLSSSIFVLVLAMTILSVGEIWTMPFMSTITALRSGRTTRSLYGIVGYRIFFVIHHHTLCRNIYRSRKGFTFLWFGTGILMALTALGFYFTIPWMLGDKKVDETSSI